MVAKVLFGAGPGLALLFGYREENLRQIETILGVKVVARGNEVTVKGPKAAVEAAKRVLERMRDGSSGSFSSEEVRTMASGRGGTKGASARETPERSLVIHTPRGVVSPRGIRQEEYVRAIRSSDIVLGVGPAGTGKTYLAVGCALSSFVARQVERIILVRPVVEAGERLGFLPGDVQEKVNPYMRPLYDALQDMIDLPALRRLLQQEVIEIAPLAYMRGRTLNRAFIILDEAQNTTIEQMKMFLTRLGGESRMVVTGDVTQIDLPKETRSGLVHAAGLLCGAAGIRIVNFLPDDVVRHHLVQRILGLYEKAN